MNSKSHYTSGDTANLADALVGDLENISDDDLAEDLRTSGGDPKREAAELRALVRNVIRAGDRDPLLDAAEKHKRDVRDLRDIPCELPSTAEGKREMLNVYLSRDSADDPAKVTAQYRDLTRLTDEDVDSILRNFMKLEAMGGFSRPRSDTDFE